MKKKVLSVILALNIGVFEAAPQCYADGNFSNISLTIPTLENPLMCYQNQIQNDSEVFYQTQPQSGLDIPTNVEEAKKFFLNNNKSRSWCKALVRCSCYALCSALGYYLGNSVLAPFFSELFQHISTMIGFYKITQKTQSVIDASIIFLSPIFHTELHPNFQNEITKYQGDFKSSNAFQFLGDLIKSIIFPSSWIIVNKYRSNAQKAKDTIRNIFKFLIPQFINEKFLDTMKSCNEHEKEKIILNNALVDYVKDFLSKFQFIFPWVYFDEKTTNTFDNLKAIILNGLNDPHKIEADESLWKNFFYPLIAKHVVYNGKIQTKNGSNTFVLGDIPYEILALYNLYFRNIFKFNYEEIDKKLKQFRSEVIGVINFEELIEKVSRIFYGD